MTGAETAIIVCIITVGVPTVATSAGAFMRIGGNAQKLDDIIRRVERLEEKIDNNGNRGERWSEIRRQQERQRR